MQFAAVLVLPAHALKRLLLAVQRCHTRNTVDLLCQCSVFRHMSVASLAGLAQYTAVRTSIACHM
jgi:hypothetical protein